MCESCRQRCIKTYGDDEIWQEAMGFYDEFPYAGALAHGVYEDDNVSDPYGFAWSVGWIESKDWGEEYTKEDIRHVTSHLNKLYHMATTKLGWILPDEDD